MWLVYIPIVIACYAANPGPRCEVNVAPLAYVQSADCKLELVRMLRNVRRGPWLIAMGGKCVVRGLGLVL